MFLASLTLLAATPQASEEPSYNVTQISEAMGHMIGENLKEMGVPFDLEAIVRGIQHASKGEHSPMSDEACVQAISLLQEEHFEQESARNLSEATQFLAENLKQSGIQTLEEGKLQYRVEREGTGSKVESYNSPIVRFHGRYLNGQPITLSPNEERLSLDETIPGLSRGIVGMKEGEVRTLYIHPDLGFGNQTLFQPNTLLIFEVEVLSADAAPAPEETPPSETIR